MGAVFVFGKRLLGGDPGGEGRSGVDPREEEPADSESRQSAGAIARIDGRISSGDGARPAPRVADASPLGTGWASVAATYAERLEGCLLHDALATLWRFVGAGNRYVDALQPWVLAKSAKSGDEAAAAMLRDVLGELLAACRVIGLAVAPFMPDSASGSV